MVDLNHWLNNQQIKRPPQDDCSDFFLMLRFMEERAKVKWGLRWGLTSSWARRQETRQMLTGLNLSFNQFDLEIKCKLFIKLLQVMKYFKISPSGTCNIVSKAHCCEGDDHKVGGF